MLNIRIPDNNLPEREYAIRTMFSEYLGLEYELAADSNIQDYSIKFDGIELIIRDGFFSKYPDPLTYLTHDALPDLLEYGKNEFTTEEDIPVIYGSETIRSTAKGIICDIDIFASVFFMLTRWEEYVNESRDEHNRFPGKESIAYKEGFLHRPLVNEYVELLWAMLLKAGFRSERKPRSFELVLTHDIDQMDYPGIIRIISGDILKRRNLKLAWRNFIYFLKSGQNPYDTFDFIMSASEKLGLKSHFYFMSSDAGKAPDNDFYLKSKRFTKKIEEIKARDHEIGFHPGYYTCDNPQRWEHEKQLLENAVKCQLTEGRQHYLRCEIPGTFRIWEQNGMIMDSTMGYARQEGFRCGTGDIFPVFDFLEREQLQLKERPLIVMDGSLAKYSKEEALKIIQHYIASGKKYRSPITLLFHNTTFYGESWKGYDHIYLKSLGLTDFKSKL